MAGDMTPDHAGIARLLAHFEACGCQGAVIAGTNGEGPSLSAGEKRDLLKSASAARGKLTLILGVATSSLDEAHWLCRRAAELEASAVLLMPPSYFRSVTEDAIVDWFLWVLDRSPVPILVYNLPKFTGWTASSAA
jgi:4-hydroxy-tetrahydrodipicolinate synthase